MNSLSKYSDLGSLISLSDSAAARIDGSVDLLNACARSTGALSMARIEAADMQKYSSAIEVRPVLRYHSTAVKASFVEVDARVPCSTRDLRNTHTLEFRAYIVGTTDGFLCHRRCLFPASRVMALGMARLETLGDRGALESHEKQDQ